MTAEGAVASTQRLFVLFEHASGYALFRVKGFDQIQGDIGAASDAGVFASVVRFQAFSPFQSSANALDNANCISEGILHDDLKVFLESNLPLEQKSKVALGVLDARLGSAIIESVGVNCVAGSSVPEITRGIKTHFHFYIKGLTSKSEMKAHLGLSHGFSRCKVKFNVNRADNMIIQSSSLIEQVDKDVNTFSMRIREWFSYHFPELAKIVSDNASFVRLVSIIKDKSDCPNMEAEIMEVVNNQNTTDAVITASKRSMGMELSPLDLLNIRAFCHKTIAMIDYRIQLADYLLKKMVTIAPNLTALIGDHVGAKLISRAGSLVNLAKYPASTIQILGAEKALFRAIKMRSAQTPKYGILFHSPFISRATAKFKGRISRYLANKCAIASRLDYFSDRPNSVFGLKMKEMVEERLSYFETGIRSKPNEEFMAEAAAELQEFEKLRKELKKKRKEKKKKAQEAAEMEQATEEQKIEAE